MTAEERLALVRVKIERAKHHIGDLSAELAAFSASKPYGVEGKIDPDTRKPTYYITKVDAIPLVVSAIAGDIIQNLRSVLDHLVTQLYFVNNPKATNSTDLHFPIDSSAAQFKASAHGKVKGLRKDAVDAICALEPYDGGKGSGFFVLNKLNRIDKHRMLVTVHAQLTGVNIGQAMAGMVAKVFQDRGKNWEVPNINLFVRPAYKGALKIGDAVYTGGADHEVDKNMQFAAEISFYEPGVIEGEPILITLQHFTDLVDGTITAFKPLLA